MSSPFLTPSYVADANSLAILHVRRNLQVATVLKSHDDENEGYDEGKVTNTRYGSFPHSTLIGNPWGAQIIASKVDTGSRGRRGNDGKGARGRKRKAGELEEAKLDDENKPAQKAAVAASSGFIHLLRPTPENWTASLPHRTQVVYAPDYSYILHRLRARPGCTLIEAGAGSGSFTHAAARAVFSGYPSNGPAKKRRRLGKVCSFEFHGQRAEKLREEIGEHGLNGIVHVHHRDVYNEGLLLGDGTAGESPNANAIFLDLPAPWKVLKHLAREPVDGSVSPLDPSSPIHICTFSPCLEQAQKTISALRQHFWLSISMVEVRHRHIEVRRERYGVEGDGSKGAPGPKNVDDCVNRLRAFEERGKAVAEAHETGSGSATPGDGNGAGNGAVDIPESEDPDLSVPQSKSSVPAYRQGNLIHRSEPDVKTHTSYLVFAILPCSWSEEDERRCREKWPSRTDGDEPVVKKSKKQLKREAREQERQGSPTKDNAGAASEGPPQ